MEKGKTARVFAKTYATVNLNRSLPEDALPYLPHLSLLYGSYPKSLKEQIVGTLPNSLSVQFTASAVTLFRVEGNSPKDWHRVQTFGFSRRDKQEPSD